MSELCNNSACFSVEIKGTSDIYSSRNYTGNLPPTKLLANSSIAELIKNLAKNL